MGTLKQLIVVTMELNLFIKRKMPSEETNVPGVKIGKIAGVANLKADDPNTLQLWKTIVTLQLSHDLTLRGIRQLTTDCHKSSAESVYVTAAKETTVKFEESSKQLPRGCLDREEWIGVVHI